jgi:TPR repeat protein
MIRNWFKKRPAQSFHMGESGLPPNATDQAETWLRRAADAGDFDAMPSLALLLVKRGDHDEAEIWARKAAEAGHSGAMVSLGLLLHRRGDRDGSETWWRKAADAGDPMARTLLRSAENGDA